MVLISDITNQYLIGEDGAAYFSQSGDWIDAEAGYEMIRGKETVMHSGDDSYFGTSFNSLGWDNNVSGNRGNDTLIGSWLESSRDYFLGGKDNDVIDGGLGGGDFLHGAWGDDSIWG